MRTERESSFLCHILLACHNFYTWTLCFYILKYILHFENIIRRRGQKADDINEKPSPGTTESWLWSGFLNIILISCMSPKHQNPFPLFVFLLIPSKALFSEIPELPPFASGSMSFFYPPSLGGRELSSAEEDSSYTWAQTGTEVVPRTAITRAAALYPAREAAKSGHSEVLHRASRNRWVSSSIAL